MNTVVWGSSLGMYLQCIDKAGEVISMIMTYLKNSTLSLYHLTLYRLLSPRLAPSRMKLQASSTVSPTWTIVGIAVSS